MTRIPVVHTISGVYKMLPVVTTSKQQQYKLETRIFFERLPESIMEIAESDGRLR